MAIYQRGKVWWIDYYFGKRRIREPVSESKKEAVEALKARKGDIAKGRFELKKEQRAWQFEEFSCEYADHLKSSRRAWDKELSRLKHLVRQFGRMFLGEITPYHVEKYKAKRREKVAGPSVNRELALLKSMFNEARRWGFVKTENPVQGVKYYPERQKERILSSEESRRLIVSSGESLRPVVIVALNAGMRKSEILDLRWENVNFSRRFIRVERCKNNRSRKVPMNSAVHDVLLKLSRNGSEYVFTKSRSSEKLNCVRTAFKTACKNAGLENLRFHDIRHTFATNLVMSGVDLVTVKEILGHSDIGMTVRYSHPSSERKMEAVERLVQAEKADAESAERSAHSHNLVTISDSEEISKTLTH